MADYDQFATFNQIALWWHELGDYSVAWDPFLCGGATLVGNPQVPLFHPNLPLYWLFGPVNGLGLSFIPWSAVGFFGMYRLATHFGMRPTIAGWIAFAFVLNGFFVGQLGSMHALYTAFYCLPLLFLLNRAIAVDGSGRAAAVFPFALLLPSLYNHHFLAYAFPFVVGHFAVELLLAPMKGMAKKALLYGVAVALTLGMLALFMLPSLAWNAEFPRFKAGEFEPPLNLLQMLLLPVQIIPFDVEHDMFERYYTLGPVLFWFLVVAVWRRQWARRPLRGLVVVALVAFVVAVGSAEPFGLPPITPFDLVRSYVPGYQAIRVPSRFFVNAMPAVLLVVGFEWQRRIDEGRWSPRKQTWMAIAALAPLWIFNFAYLQFSLFSEERAVDRVQRAAVSPDFRWGPTGFRFRMMRVLEPSVGILDCYEALEVPKAEALDPGAGLVLAASSTPRIERPSWGELVATVDAPAPDGFIRFNFNHHRGWQVVASDGPAVIQSDNRQPLEVALAGASFVRLRYVEPAWPLGVRISLVSLALAAIFAVTAILGSTRSAGRA